MGTRQTPLRYTKAALRAAKTALERMRSTDVFEEFVDEWLIFINCLEKVWVKAERECQPFRNIFEPWQGRFHATRKRGSCPISLAELPAAF
jgi:hypothetical protein